MTVSIIVAVCENNVIGKNGRLPWRLPADLKFFKETTMGHTLIMGRKTFESVGKKSLPGRKTIVITRQKNYDGTGCLVVPSLQDAITSAANDDELFIAGGAEIYKEALKIADKIYLTRIHHEFEGDVFLPAIDMSMWIEESRKDFVADEKNPFPYSFCILKRK